MANGHCANYHCRKRSRGAGRNETPRVPPMTGYKMRRIQVRLEKLGKLFPEKPVVTPEQAIRRATVQQMSCEDLMTLRRMIKAGRLQASNERESQAVAAYRSAVERVIRLAGGSSKRGINRLIDG
jgi:hypothetical protein